MSFFRKIRSIFHGDWCKECTEVMDITKKQLYMLPVLVDHYISHNDATYYKNNLIKVNRKADIPIGYYACGITVYCCPKCDYKCVKLSIFLPVRDQEKYEDTVYFENGEMDDFIYKSAIKNEI